jgi:hypothetical protein
MVSLKRLDLRVEELGPHVFILSNFAHYGLRALLKKPVRRGSELVHAEYGHEARQGYWKARESLTPDEYIFDNHESPRWVLIDHQLVRRTLRAVRERVLPHLRDRVAQYSKPGDLVVEFGAGTGRNLAYLARELPDRRYIGLELTPQSVEDADKMLKLCGVNVEMRIADMTQPSQLPEKAAISYSIQALEQLPGTKSRSALQQMVDSSRNAVLCIEPIRELYPNSVRGWTSRLRQYRADYLRGLPGFAKELGLNVVKLERLGLAENPLNEVCELLVEL